MAICLLIVTAFVLSSGRNCPLSTGSYLDYNAIVLVKGKTYYESSNMINKVFDEIDNGTSCQAETTILGADYHFEDLLRFTQYRCYHPQSADEVEELINFYERDWKQLHHLINDTLTVNQSIAFSGSLVLLFNNSMLPDDTDIARIGPSYPSIMGVTDFQPVSMNTDFSPKTSITMNDEYQYVNVYKLAVTVGYYSINIAYAELTNLFSKRLFPGNAYTAHVGSPWGMLYEGQITAMYGSITNALDDVKAPNTWNSTFDDFWVSGYSNATGKDYVVYIYGMSVDCVSSASHHLPYNETGWCQMFIDGVPPEPTTTAESKPQKKEDKVWMIVAIVALVLFVIVSVAFIVVTVSKSKKPENRGYSTPSDGDL